MGEKKFDGRYFYERFNRYASDLYPNRYDKLGFCEELAELANEVVALKKERQAIILAHNYQLPEIQEIADYNGDSLGLSQQAAAASGQVIVFCGVHFMAETAAILCPDKLVLLPDLEAGCSLAACVTAPQLEAWRKKNPDAVVVSYVNTTAEVKALSDYCCTSRNAQQVVQAIPEGREILFLPDKYLGAVVSGLTRRPLTLWPGQCHVHVKIGERSIDRAIEDHPEAEILIHPECGCATTCLSRAMAGNLPRNAYFLSTEGMTRHIEKSSAREFIVGTEKGMVYRLRVLSPDRTFHPVSDEALCEYMKCITLDKVVRSLKKLVHQIKVPPQVADRARQSIHRMLSVV
jgi:quinolinate synthase